MVTSEDVSQPSKVRSAMAIGYSTLCEGAGRSRRAVDALEFSPQGLLLATRSFAESCEGIITEVAVAVGERYNPRT